MVKVIAHNFIKKENLAAAMPLYEKMVAATRKEDGCIQYELYRDNEDETHFVFDEAWESQAHLDAHVKTEHFVTLIPQIGALSDDSRAKDVQKFTLVY